MDFTLTEEQKQIVALIKDFCKREVDLKRMDALVDAVMAAKTVEEVRALYPKDLIEKMHDVGLRQLCVPEKYGGGGHGRFGSVTRAVAAEQLGYWMGVADRLLIIPWMHTAAISGFGATEEQKDFFFTRFMADHTLWPAMVGSEPGGNTDMGIPYTGPGAQMNTFAYKDGNEWVINGDKMFSSGGAVAGLLRVMAYVDKKRPPTESITQFLVEKDAPGVTYILNRFCFDEIAGNASIHLDNVRVTEDHLLGEVGDASLVGAEIIAKKMICYCDIVGQARRIYEQVVEYAKQKIGGGRPIIEHSVIAAMLGEAAYIIEALRSYMYRSAWEMDEQERAGLPPNNFWSMGNFYLVKTWMWRFCQLVSEVYGGIGGSVDMPLERFVRRLFVWTPSGYTPSMNAIKGSMFYNDHTVGENLEKLKSLDRAGIKA